MKILLSLGLALALYEVIMAQAHFEPQERGRGLEAHFPPLQERGDNIDDVEGGHVFTNPWFNGDGKAWIEVKEDTWLEVVYSSRLPESRDSEVEVDPLPRNKNKK